jgi:hypothetical protein
METEAKSVLGVETENTYEAPELVRHGDIDELTQGHIFIQKPGDCESIGC